MNFYNKSINNTKTYDMKKAQSSAFNHQTPTNVNINANNKNNSYEASTLFESF